MSKTFRLTRRSVLNARSRSLSMCGSLRLFSVLTFGTVCACLRLLCVMAVCVCVCAPLVRTRLACSVPLCVCVYPKPYAISQAAVRRLLLIFQFDFCRFHFLTVDFCIMTFFLHIWQTNISHFLLQSSNIHIIVTAFFWVSRSFFSLMSACLCACACVCVRVCSCISRTKRDRIVPGHPIRATMHSMWPMWKTISIRTSTWLIVFFGKPICVCANEFTANRCQCEPPLPL